MNLLHPRDEIYLEMYMEKNTADLLVRLVPAFILLIVVIIVVIWLATRESTAGETVKEVTGGAVSGVVSGVGTGLVDTVAYATDSVAPGAYGMNVELGGTCSGDKGCKNGLTCCKNVCVEKNVLDDGKECCDDTQCKNGRCAWVYDPSINQSKKVCCKNAKYDKSRRKWMCHDQGYNAYCEADDWCTSGKCKNRKCESKCIPGRTSKVRLGDNSFNNTLELDVGKWSFVNAKDGYTKPSGGKNDTYTWICVPAGLKAKLYDNDSGKTSGWYGHSEITGPYTGPLGPSGTNITAKSGKKGHLGRKGKLTSIHIYH
jgi:hypothetical protein